MFDRLVQFSYITSNVFSVYNSSRLTKQKQLSSSSLLSHCIYLYRQRIIQAFSQHFNVLKLLYSYFKGISYFLQPSCAQLLTTVTISLQYVAQRVRLERDANLKFIGES